MEEIEKFKENIPPKRDGYRVVDLLTPAAEIKNKYENLEDSVNQQQSTGDPLSSWFKLACFSKIHFVDLGLSKVQLIALYDKVINLFINVPAYKNDKRYVKIWLYYCSMVNDVETAFNKMRTTGIGNLVAERYIANAEYLVRKKRISEAKQLINEGLSLVADAQLKSLLAFKEELDTLQSTREEVGIFEITPFHQNAQPSEQIEVNESSANRELTGYTRLQPYKTRNKENTAPFEKLVAVPKSPSVARAKASFSIYFDESGPTVSYYERDSREAREVTYQIFKKFTNPEKPPQFAEGIEIVISGKQMKVVSMFNRGKIDCWVCEIDNKEIILCIPALKSRTVYLTQANIARWCSSIMVPSFHASTFGNCLVLPANYNFLSDCLPLNRSEIIRVTNGILTAMEALWKYQAIHGSISEYSFIVSTNNVQLFSYCSMFLPERVSAGLKNGISLPVEQQIIEIDSRPLAALIYRIWTNTPLITENKEGMILPKRKIDDVVLKDMVIELLNFKSCIVVQAQKSLLKDESSFKTTFTDARKMVKKLMAKIPSE